MVSIVKTFHPTERKLLETFEMRPVEEPLDYDQIDRESRLKKLLGIEDRKSVV